LSHSIEEGGDKEQSRARRLGVDATNENVPVERAACIDCAAPGAARLVFVDETKLQVIMSLVSALRSNTTERHVAVVLELRKATQKKNVA
jgi:hypothetical protein